MPAPSTAVTLVNGSATANPIWGVPADETNLYIDTMRFSAKPQFIESLGNRQNVTVVDAYAPVEIELTLSGEVTTSAATGAPSLAVSTAFTPANTFAYFGLGTSTYVYRFQGGDINYSRSGFAKLDGASYKAKAGVN